MISIIIPAYNYARFLPSAINSVLQQNINDVEIIICDDCSTDETRSISEIYANADSRIKYIRNDKNLGATGNINQGIKRASGDYVVLLGADDMLVPGSLQKLKGILDQHPECGFVFGRYTMLTEDERSIPLQHPGWLAQDYFASRDELPDLLKFDCYINIGASMFRRDILGDEDFFDTNLSAFDTERFFRATDWDKVMNLSLKGVQSAFINSEISIFRLHNQQASSGDRYGRSGLAFFEHSILLEKYFTAENVNRLLPHLAEIIRLYQSKFEFFVQNALPEFEERKSLAEQRANQLLSHIEKIISQSVSQSEQHFTETDISSSLHDPIDPDHPFFSIILTTYNRPHLAVNALQSIASQTYKNFEIIMVNDGGVVQENLIEWLCKDLNITYVRQPNRGVAAARNLALRLARGQYVVYLDDDDLMYNHHLARLHHEACHNPGALVFGNAHFITEQVNFGLREDQRKSMMACKKYDFNRLQITNYIPINALAHPLLAIEKVGGFDESLASHEDWDLLIRLSRTIPFVHFNDTTVQVRRRLGNGQEYDSRTVQAWQNMKHDFEIIYGRYNDMGIQEIIDARRKVLAADHPTAAGLNFN